MKILHLVPGLSSGGVAQVVYDLAKSQQEKGWVVEILSLYRRNYKNDITKFDTIGLRVKSICVNSKIDLSIIGLLKRIFKNYDIVHVHLFPNQFYASLAYRLIRKKERPILITTEHSTWNNRRKYPIFRFLDYWTYSVYDRIIAISPETKIQLEKWIRFKKIISKIVVIYNGIQLSKFQVKSNYIRKGLGIPETHKIVVMVSRMVYPKDPVTLVKAVRDYHDVDVIFVGAGELNKEVKELSKELMIEDRIHILDLRSDVPFILSESDIGCLSTKWDGFGLVAVEYMAAGLPVLVTDVPGLREVVGNKKCLFPYKSSSDLSAKIYHLIKSPAYYNEQREYSLERCRIFSVEMMTTKYNELYQTLKCSKESSL